MKAIVNIEYGIPHLYMEGNPDFEDAVKRMDGNSYELYEDTWADVFLELVKDWCEEQIPVKTGLFVGAKVRIKPLEWFEIHAKDAGHGYTCKDGCFMAPGMLSMCGKVLEVKEVIPKGEGAYRAPRYVLKGDALKYFHWTDDMFDIIK